MINKDLYCKNCFKRIFTKEGKYSSFGEKTLPKAEAERLRASTVDASSTPAPAGRTASASVSVAPSSTATSSDAARRSSVVLPCVVADCKAPRVARKSYCIQHLNQANEATPATASAAAAAKSEHFDDLLEAITKKNVDRVKDILRREPTTAILFQTTPRKQTPIELAFTGIANSRACGEAMLTWLQERVSELEKMASNTAATAPSPTPSPSPATPSGSGNDNNSSESAADKEPSGAASPDGASISDSPVVVDGEAEKAE